MWQLLFRYPAADFRAGEWVWVGGWPTWALALAIAAAAVWIGLQLVRSRRFSPGHAWAIGALEVAAAALVLALLWRPALAVDRLESARNVVAVLLDTSRSMAIPEGGSSRLELAVRALDPGVLSALGERFDVRLYAFDDALRETDGIRALAPSGERTQLAGALRQALESAQSQPLGAVLLVSDGGAQDAGQLAALWPEIERAGVPIHSVGVGSESLPEDLELADVSVPASVLPGSRVDARVVVRHGGAGRARLVVSEGAAVLAAREIELDAAQPAQVEWISFPAGGAGVRDLRFALDVRADERVAGNNAQARVLEVLDRPRRVLYVEGEPRWEYGFLRRAVGDDRGLELVGVLSTTDRKRYRQGVRGEGELETGFPADREALFAYDALILGSVEAASLEPAQQELIRAFVGERGGGLLMIGGRRGLADGGWGATPVQEVLPVELPRGDKPSFVRSAAAVQLTAYGAGSPIVQLDPDPRRNRALWSSLPDVADHQRVGELKPGASSLLETTADGRSSPLLAVQRYGRGRAAVLATGGTWRWKMGVAHDDPRFATFWRQLLRFLAAPSASPVNLSVAAEDAGEASAARIRFEVRGPAWQPLDSPELSLRVVPEAGPPRELELQRASEPGVYEAQFAPEPGAMYRVEGSARAGGRELGSAQLHLRPAPGLGEDFHPELNRALLERIATASGGAFWSLDSLGGLPDAIRASALGVRHREVLDLWSLPACFLLLLALKGSAWLLRRRLGAV